MNSEEYKTLLNKLELLDMKIESIEKTSIRQEINLREHMKRSDSLEQMLLSLEEDLKPIEKHVAMVEGAIKFLGIISISLSVLGGILKLFGVL